MLEKRILHNFIIMEQLTRKDMEREKQCWEKTSLEILLTRGVTTGLTAYLKEVEERLSRLFDLSEEDY